MNLAELKTGQNAVIASVGGEGALRQHFLDMGLIPGAELTVVKFAPLGDPIEIQVHGYELSLRLAEAAKIDVRKIDKRANPHTRVNRIDPSEHPGLGEDGRYHSREGEDPLPDGTVLRFALVGNQNSGKTTLFNQLTGANQHVGNFPGVTVDRKDGPIKGHPNTLVTDLPGIYSMSPYTSEEIISRQFVLDEKPQAIINIVDATNIERNLYLTMQLLEMDVPMVVALNMMDEITANNGAIDINKMEEKLGVPVVPISAVKNAGVSELIDHALHIAKYQERPSKQDFCSKDDHGGAIHRAIHAVQSVIEDHAERADIPPRFAATKVIEGDKLVLEKLSLDQNELDMIEHMVVQMEHEGGMDRAAAMADMRFDFIERVCESTVEKPEMSIERKRSEKIDGVLTGKWTAIPCFIGIMAVVFILTFNYIGPFLQGIIENMINSLAGVVGKSLEGSGVNPAIRGLINDGIFGGVGSVLSFIPIVVTLFFFLSIMEDSGYIARVAFVMDKLFRRIGLSGRSIVPMLIGFGCTVPAVMATRTLPSRRDRRLTILLTPFMSCTAKIPIYAFLVNAFFPGKGGFIMTGLYVLGVFTSILIALAFKKTIFKGEAVPFVMELPNYRMPGVRNVLQLLWDKAKDFLQRAFGVILFATIIVWFLRSFDFSLNLVSDSEDSILASIAGIMVPLFEPIGLGDWRIVTSLISGFMAKESVVATMKLLFGADVSAALSQVSAAALLVFSLLYTPCVAAVAAVRRELGGMTALSMVVWQCMVAWAGAFIVRAILIAAGL
ncbi:MAG: ferrous iron transport protein B [Eubacterium sp.]|nr:ferrous iron transport protein B [Eubacterium sp.]